MAYILCFMAGGVIGILTMCVFSANRISDLEKENHDLRRAVRMEKLIQAQKENAA